MSLEHYALESDEDYLSFEFYSDGPKGAIKKVIHYTKLKLPGREIYNLGFGDFNTETGKVDDLSITNNSDREKVLATVASSVLYFFEKYPNAQVAFKGSTDTRTRLYVMEISKHLDQLDRTFIVEGLTSAGWESFRKNRRYLAVWVTPKNS